MDGACGQSLLLWETVIYFQIYHSDLRDATCTLEQSARGAADGWANQGSHAVRILLFPAMDPPGGPSATLRGQTNVPHMPHVRRCRRRCRCAPSGLLPDAAAVKVTCLGTSSTVKGSLTHEFRRQHPLHNGPPAASGTARPRGNVSLGTASEGCIFFTRK